MKNPKPIFVVELPSSINHEHVDSVTKSLTEKLDDYYVIVIVGKLESVKFQCFYEKDFNEIKYEELKQIVKDSIK